jgi:hypothetical protein
MVAKNEPYGQDQQDVIDRFINGEIPLIERYYPLQEYFGDNRTVKIEPDD